MTAISLVIAMFFVRDQFPRPILGLLPAEYLMSCYLPSKLSEKLGYKYVQLIWPYINYSENYI